MDLSESKKEEVVTEPKGLLVLGGYNMDYVTEVPHLLITTITMVQVEQVGRCKGLPTMERMGEGKTRAVTG